MGKIIEPNAGQLYHGVFPGGDAGDEGQITPALLCQYETAVGRDVAWVFFSHEWSQGSAFPEEIVEWIHWHGAAPFIRLMLRSSTDQYVCEPHFTLKAIAEGKFDDDLRAWGKAAAAKGYPLICEWGTEMNGAWFPWNASHNGGAKGPGLFQDAFRRVVRVIRDSGGTNITWVFHVNHDDSPKEEWNRLESYDPGCDFSDWIGVSIYGAQKPDEDVSNYPVFSAGLDQAIQRLEKIRGKRPIMVCEFGFAAQPIETIPREWVDEALKSLLSNRWPSIRGFSWWNESWPNDNGGPTEMRVDKIPGMPALFQKHLKNNPRIVDRPIER